MKEDFFFTKLNSVKHLLAIFGIIVVALLFLSSLVIIGFRNQRAQATTCEGPTVEPCICQPADIMLVVDRSGSMAYPIEGEDKTKIAAAKEALSGPYCSGVSECVNDDGCCPTTCSKDNDDDCLGFIDNLKIGDQVGLASFSDGATLDSGLTFSKTEVKETVNALTPAGHTNMAGGIGVAYNELRDNARSGTVKVMIILGDGYPDRPHRGDDPDYPANTAKAIATTAKNNGIRIITIGYNIPEPPEGEELDCEEYEAFCLMKEIASVPADYHSAPDSAALETIYNDIKGSLCDCKAPDLTLSRSPANTIYPEDEITIISKADDDYGIGSHELEWTTNGWLSYDSHTCSPEGKTDTCSKNIGSFTSGTIDFRAKAEDTAGNKTNEDGACAFGSFSVADVTITSGDLIKQRENVVKVHISDPQGKADLNSFYLSIDSPALSETWKTDKGLMTCTGTGFELDCVYNVTPDCSWGASGRILVFPYDAVVGFHNPAAEKTVNVNIVEEEGEPYCSDGINNDCDEFIDDADPSCDSEIDTLFISRDPSGVVLNSDTVTLTSTAADASGIQNHKIKYQLNSGGWITAFDCWDTAPVDGKCDADPTKNIGSFDVTIGPFNVGDFVEYKSEATDNNGYTGYTSTYSFTVQNAECYAGTTPINDVTVKCNGGAGRCCGGVCDTSFSCSLDDECREEICSGTSWTCGPANEGVDCCDGSDCDGCYSYEDGCEERNYSCTSGECVPSISDRHPDACDIILKYRFWDYGCRHIPFLGEQCILKNNIDCRLPNNWDGDGILCNCDCDSYDVEETISNGNCTDGKDNDCDSNIGGNDCGGGSCIDCEEPACDDEAPTTVITAYDKNGIKILPKEGGNVLDTDTDKVSLNVESVEVSPCATSPNSLYQVKVFYNENDGPWNLIFTCTDADGDSQCDEDILKNIANFNAEIPVSGFSSGTKVGYKSEATDTAPVHNTGDNEGYFIVTDIECAGEDDLTPCTGGICCGESCDTTQDCSLDIGCSKNACSGTSWICVPDNEGVSCAPGTWTKRRAISIGNSSSSKLINYQVKLDIFYDSDMQLDFDDLRFKDENEEPLNYWIESKTNGVSAAVWVKIPEIPTTGTTIYVYYGNSSVGSAGDGDATFEFFDGGEEHSDGDSLTTGNWNIWRGSQIKEYSSDKAAQGSMSLHLGGNSDAARHLIPNLSSAVLEADFWDENVTGNRAGKIGMSDQEVPAGGWDFNGSLGYWDNPNPSTYKANWDGEQSTGINRSQGWHKLKIVLNSDNTLDYYVDGIHSAANPGTFTSVGYVHIWAYQTQNVYVDNIRVRKYVSPKPTFTIQAEESISFIESSGCYFYHLGCEERNYSCASGHCLYSLSDQNTDMCSLSNLLDYACVGDECEPSSIDCAQPGSIDGCACNCGGYGREEKFYNALDFDGVDDYVKIPDDPDLEPAYNLTVEAWAKLAVVPPLSTPGNTYKVVGHSFPSNSGKGYDLHYYGYHGKWIFEIRNNEISMWTEVGSTYGRDTNWHHLVSTYDGNELRLYIDGVLRDSVSENRPIAYRDDTTVTISDSEFGHVFDGLIDEVRIYNRALSAEEITEHYRGEFINDTGLVGYWNFDEGAGTVANDSSGNGNDGTLKNGPAWISGADDSENVAPLWRVCSDGKDNDCDGDFDLDGSDPEAACDNLAPTVMISAKDNQDKPIDDGAEVPDEYTDKVTITSTATENPIGLNAVKYHEVFYRINEGTWNSVYRCDDVAPADGKCDSDSSKNISSFSVEIGPFASGVNVEYKSVATDTAIYPNTGSAQASFSVITYNIPPTVSVDPDPDSEIHPDYCKCGPGITVTWNFDDEDSEDSQSAYQIQIDDNSDFSAPEIDTEKIINSSDSYSTPSGSLAYAKTYYWRVKVWDTKDGQSDWQDKDTEGNILQFSTPLHYWPTVDFTFSPENPEKGIPVHFTNLSFYYKTGDLIPETEIFVQHTYNVSLEEAPQEVLDSAFAWDFDYCDYEGFTVESTEKDPTYYFLKPNSCLYANTFTVALKVTDQDGYTCMTTKNITIGSEASKYPRWKETVPE